MQAQDYLVGFPQGRIQRVENINSDSYFASSKALDLKASKAILFNMCPNSYSQYLSVKLSALSARHTKVTLEIKDFSFLNQAFKADNHMRGFR